MKHLVALAVLVFGVTQIAAAEPERGAQILIEGRGVYVQKTSPVLRDVKLPAIGSCALVDTKEAQSLSGVKECLGHERPLSTMTFTLPDGGKRTDDNGCVPGQLCDEFTATISGDRKTIKVQLTVVDHGKRILNIDELVTSGRWLLIRREPFDWTPDQACLEQLTDWVLGRTPSPQQWEDLLLVKPQIASQP